MLIDSHRALQLLRIVVVAWGLVYIFYGVWAGLIKHDIVESSGGRRAYGRSATIMGTAYIAGGTFMLCIGALLLRD